MTWDGDVTTRAAADVYDSATPIFHSLLREIKSLSHKKPDATLSKNKVRIINRVLEDVLGVLKDQPSGKYLELLDDDALPQVSDALLVMVQFDTALKAFRERYLVITDHGAHSHWATEEWAAESAGDEPADEEDEEE